MTWDEILILKKKGLKACNRSKGFFGLLNKFSFSSNWQLDYICYLHCTIFSNSLTEIEVFISNSHWLLTLHLLQNHKRHMILYGKKNNFLNNLHNSRQTNCSKTDWNSFFNNLRDLRNINGRTLEFKCIGRDAEKIYI